MTTAAEEYAGPLRKVIEKGQYEEKLTVCGDEVIMHVAKVKEERAVRASTSNVALLDREYESWLHRLSHVCTRVNGRVFTGPDDALSFFEELTQPHIDEYVVEYSRMVAVVRDRLRGQAQEIKNS